MTSTVETSVRDIAIHKLPPGRVVAIEKAVAIDGTTVFLGKDGKVYCPRVKDKLYFMHSHWNFFSPLMNGLAKLGVLTRAEADKVIADAKAVRARNDAQYDLKQFDELAAAYGVKVPARERAKLVKAAGK